MIERIALDNFRGFESFEWRPGPLNLLSGTNGAGKSTLLDVIFGVTGVVALGADPSILFIPESLSRGGKSKVQKLELDLASAMGLYEYLIEVEHDPKDLRAGMVALRETLTLNGTELLDLDVGIVKKGKKTGTFFQGLSMLADQKEPDVVSFCDHLKRIILTSKSSHSRMSGIPKASTRLAPDLSTFPAWFNGVKMKDQKSQREIARSLKALFGIELTTLVPSGSGLDPKHFNGLSSGERALWAQRLLACTLEPASVLMLDDPEIHVELGQIQPWLQGCLKAVESTGSQLLIASHHPEMVDCLGSVADHWWLGKMRRGSGRSIHRQSSPGRPSLSGVSEAGPWPMLE